MHDTNEVINLDMLGPTKEVHGMHCATYTM